MECLILGQDVKPLVIIFVSLVKKDDSELCVGVHVLCGYVYVSASARQSQGCWILLKLELQLRVTQHG